MGGERTRTEGLEDLELLEPQALESKPALEPLALESQLLVEEPLEQAPEQTGQPVPIGCWQLSWLCGENHLHPPSQ